jgi:hypothetical protein
MAGKTFPGIGDLEDESAPLAPADAADSGGDGQFYSGPTVVDEAKVEQGLKKLRSLDAPPGPLTGIHRAVADALDDPRVTPQVTIPGTLMMPEFKIDAGRGTAVGRSVSGPIPGQQTTQPFDDRALRGTMFGHGVHLPDLDVPDLDRSRPKEVETTKAIAIVERGMPTTNEIAIFQPGPYAQHGGIPHGHDPQLRSNRFHARETPIDLRTVSPRKKVVLRVAAAAACMGAIVVAALLWVRSTNEEAETGLRPTATLPAPAPTHPIDVAPMPQQATPPLPAAGATAPPPPTLAPKAPSRNSDEDDLPGAGSPAHPRPAPAALATRPAASPVAAPAAPLLAGPAAPLRRGHPSATRPERRHSAAPKASDDDGRKLDKGDKPDQAAAPAKPTRPKRSLEDDPDATMAPTIE